MLHCTLSYAVLYPFSAAISITPPPISHPLFLTSHHTFKPQPSTQIQISFTQSMEAKLFQHHGVFSPLRTAPSRKLTLRPQRLHTVESVSTTPSHKNDSLKVSEPKTVYNDNWFDRIAIDYLSQSLQDTTGAKNKKSGYDSLVDAATLVSQTFSKTTQQELILQTLDRAFPRPILSFIRTMMPQSKIAREYFAVFTTIFFPWLVGACEVKESEFEGRKERNVVYVKKCRFLEETGCVGMCTNLCKMPSQKFIKDTLGMPFHMVPNFDDMSCEMIFGVEPPAPSDDPALKQPCYKFICKAKKKYSSECAN